MGALKIGPVNLINFIQEIELDNNPDSGDFSGGRTWSQML